MPPEYALLKFVEHTKKTLLLFLTCLHYQLLHWIMQHVKVALEKSIFRRLMLFFSNLKFGVFYTLALIFLKFMILHFWVRRRFFFLILICLCDILTPRRYNFPSIKDFSMSFSFFFETFLINLIVSNSSSPLNEEF